MDDRYDASDQADRYENAHKPQELGRVRDTQDPASEIDSRPADQREPNRTGDEDQNQEARPGILKCAGSRDGGAKWKGRRRQAGNDQRRGGMLFHLPLQIIEKLWFYQPLETFLATFPANQVQQEDADCRSGGCGEHVERELIVMPGSQEHHEQITTDRKEEKGIIGDSEEEEPEHAKLQEKSQQMAD